MLKWRSRSPLTAADAYKTWSAYMNLKGLISYGCLMIKPDAYNRGIAADVRQDILSMCKQYNLEIRGESTKILATGEVHQIYPDISRKSFVADFLNLMVSNYSTAFMLSGEDAINKTKMIRGSQRTKECDEISGIRGRYCYVADISAEDRRRLEANYHPDRERLVEIIIGGVLHASDTPDEVITISKIFNISLGK